MFEIIDWHRKKYISMSTKHNFGWFKMDRKFFFSLLSNLFYHLKGQSYRPKSWVLVPTITTERSLNNTHSVSLFFFLFCFFWCLSSYRKIFHLIPDIFLPSSLLVLITGQSDAVRTLLTIHFLSDNMTSCAD